MPVELADLNPERQPRHANPICASPQVAVGPSCIPRRRRDFPAVVLAEVDLTPDSLLGHLEPHQGELSRPFHHCSRPVLTTKTRDDAAQLGIEPPPIVGRPNLLDTTEHVSLDGNICCAPPRPRGPTSATQDESHQPGRGPAKVHQSERNRRADARSGDREPRAVGNSTMTRYGPVAIGAWTCSTRVAWMLLIRCAMHGPWSTRSSVKRRSRSSVSAAGAA